MSKVTTAVGETGTSTGSRATSRSSPRKGSPSSSIITRVGRASSTTTVAADAAGSVAVSEDDEQAVSVTASAPAPRVRGTVGASWTRG